MHDVDTLNLNQAQAWMQRLHLCGRAVFHDVFDLPAFVREDDPQATLLSERHVDRLLPSCLAVLRAAACRVAGCRVGWAAQQPGRDQPLVLGLLLLELDLLVHLGDRVLDDVFAAVPDLAGRVHRRVGDVLAAHRAEAVLVRAVLAVQLSVAVQH